MDAFDDLARPALCELPHRSCSELHWFYWVPIRLSPEILPTGVLSVRVFVIRLVEVNMHIMVTIVSNVPPDIWPCTVVIGCIDSSINVFNIDVVSMTLIITVLGTRFAIISRMAIGKFLTFYKAMVNGIITDMRVYITSGWHTCVVHFRCDYFNSRHMFRWENLRNVFNISSSISVIVVMVSSVNVTTCTKSLLASELRNGDASWLVLTLSVLSMCRVNVWNLALLRLTTWQLLPMALERCLNALNWIMISCLLNSVVGKEVTTLVSI